MPCREDFLARRRRGLFFSIFPQMHFSQKNSICLTFFGAAFDLYTLDRHICVLLSKKKKPKSIFWTNRHLQILKSSSISHYRKGFHLLNNLKMQTAMIFVFVFWWWLPPKLLLWLSNVMNCAGSYSKGLIALPKILAACNFVCLDSIYLSARAFLPRPYMKPVH